MQMLEFRGSDTKDVVSYALVLMDFTVLVDMVFEVVKQEVTGCRVPDFLLSKLATIVGHIICCKTYHICRDIDRCVTTCCRQGRNTANARHEMTNDLVSKFGNS